MEPNKLENQIREKLNAREIKPSAQSWDRLDAMLSVEENKKPKRNFKWLFAAASIIGLVFAGLFFFQQENPAQEIENNQTVVGTNADTVKEKKVQEPSGQNSGTVGKQEETDKTAIASIARKGTKARKGNDTLLKIQPFIKPETIKQEAIAENVPQKTEEKPKETTHQAEAVASNDPVKPEEQIQNKPKIKVDASALLSQVDGEIELTFRQKAIKKFSKNFKSARETVASRNRE